jgi:hypothetical protein
VNKDMKKLKQITKKLNDAVTLEEVDKSSKEASEYYKISLNQIEKDLIKKAILDEFKKSKKRIVQLDKVYNQIINTPLI